GVGQCYRATSALRRVGRDELVRISGRSRAEHSANSKEWNGNSEGNPCVRIGCNLTFERWIATVGIDHRHCGSASLLSANRFRHACACAAKNDHELTRNPAWISGEVSGTASKRNRAARIACPQHSDG